MRDGLRCFFIILLVHYTMFSCSNGGGSSGGTQVQNHLITYLFESPYPDFNISYWNENDEKIDLLNINSVDFSYQFYTDDMSKTIGIEAYYNCSGPYCSSVNLPVTVYLYIDDVLISTDTDSGGWPNASIGPDTLFNFLIPLTPTPHVTNIIDALVANNGRSEMSWWNDGTGLFVESYQHTGNLDSQSVAIGDLDGDGDLDAFIANDSQANKVYFIDPYGTFVDSGQAGLTLGFDRSFGVDLGDLDGDGDLDAFVANYGEPNKVYLNGTKPGSNPLPLGTFVDSNQTLGLNNSNSVELGDLDGDGDLDAFVVNAGGPNLVYINDGAGYFSDSGQSLGGQNSMDVALGDLDGDGDMDACVVNSKNSNKVYLNTGNGVFVDSGQEIGSDTEVSAGIALGDVNNDGKIDAFVVNEGQPNRIYLNDGLGGFVDSGQELGLDDSSNVALGDVDDDGDLDAYVTNRYGQPNKVYFNDGAGFFYDSGQELGDDDSTCVVLGKFNP